MRSSRRTFYLCASVVAGVMILAALVVSTYAVTGTCPQSRCTPGAHKCNEMEIPDPNSGCFGFPQTGDSCTNRVGHRCSDDNSNKPSYCMNYDGNGDPNTCGYNDIMTCGNVMEAKCIVVANTCQAPAYDSDKWTQVGENCSVFTCPG